MNRQTESNKPLVVSVQDATPRRLGDYLKLLKVSQMHPEVDSKQNEHVKEVCQRSRGRMRCGQIRTEAEKEIGGTE